MTSRTKVTDNLSSPNIPQMSPVTYRVVIVTSHTKQGFPHFRLVLWSLGWLKCSPRVLRTQRKEEVRIVHFTLPRYSITPWTKLTRLSSRIL